jgi:uncharacterized protein (UPF0276 family)
MKDQKIGISAHRNLKPEAFKNADFIEIKKITEQEVMYYKNLTDKPLFFHLQYTGDDLYYLPTSMNLTYYMKDITAAYHQAHPQHISLHFGPSSKSISLDFKNYIAVAKSTLLTKREIVRNLENNLKLLKSAFPDTVLLVENLEFIPEYFSKGSYRYIQETDFFTTNVLKWKEMGILDGIIFDVAHGLIAAANHPYYNGMNVDPLATGPEYIDRMKENTDIVRYYTSYISQLPTGLVKEIHISGILRLSTGVWVDAHIETSERELTCLGILLNLMQRYDAPISLEYYQDTDRAMNQLDFLRGYMREIVKTKSRGGDPLCLKKSS